MAFDPIPMSIRKVWDTWNLRGFVMLSLSLQTILIFFAPFRKKTTNMFMMFITWSAYLLADWAAAFAVGLISNSQGNDSTPADNRDLLAFWAPFLLVHLGGPDTVTAFSMADNALWLRHLFGLLIQFFAAAYVFLQTLPQNKLLIPTILMLLAGLIKYVERTKALYLANLERYKVSMLKQRDPGPSYAKFMDEYIMRKEAKILATIKITGKPDREPVTLNYEREKEGILSKCEVVMHAYHFFKILQGLVVDLIFSFHERNESRQFFQHRTPEDALKVMAVELNFLYDVLYTKVRVLHSMVGYILRFFAFANIVVSLMLFTCLKKNGFHSLDVKITYCLLYGAIALDTIALLRAVFSDWTVFAIKNIKNRSKMAIWFDKLLGAQIISIVDKMKDFSMTKCQIGNDYYDAYDTPVLFRRWSETISAYNLLSYCLKERPIQTSKPQGCLSSCFSNIVSFPSYSMGVAMSCLSSASESISSCLRLGCIFGSIAHVSGAIFHLITFKLGIADILDNINYVSKNAFIKSACIFGSIAHVSGAIFRLITFKLGIADILDNINYVSKNAFIKDLWEFIFNELQDKAMLANDTEMARKICKARGDWILQEGVWERDYSHLMQFVEDVEFDCSLLLWHIATEICYNTEKPSPDDRDDRRFMIFSKILSDYMLYLLVKQPKMMSAVAGIGQIRYLDTCVEAQMFFSRLPKIKGKEKESRLKVACLKILEVDTSVKPVDVQGDRNKSVLFSGCILAKELDKLREDKWKIMSRVWVELLSYAASHCRAETHAQVVSKGGELMTFVWLLMSHLGIGEQRQISGGNSRAKIIIGK